MIIDMHVHIWGGAPEPAVLAGKVKSCGVDQAVLLSSPPESFPSDQSMGTKDRLDNLFAWCAGQPSLIPFYWIDPTEPDAQAQVRLALDRGVRGFKVISNHFYPGDAPAMDTYRAIAAAGKAILFHSGILWDGTPSSKFCRPAEFEALLDVPRLRFALAHISWPWVDECLAVYGKLGQVRRDNPDCCEMFIDVTPGTPPIYRREALTKIFTIGYKVADNVLFGSDGGTNWYTPNHVTELIRNDGAIYESLGIPLDVRRKIFGGNFTQFVG